MEGGDTARLVGPEAVGGAAPRCCPCWPEPLGRPPVSAWLASLCSWRMVCFAAVSSACRRREASPTSSMALLPLGLAAAGALRTRLSSEASAPCLLWYFYDIAVWFVVAATREARGCWQLTDQNSGLSVVRFASAAFWSPLVRGSVGMLLLSIAQTTRTSKS